MQGRIENELKIQRKIENTLIDLPGFVSEWYLNLQASKKTAASCNDFINKIRNYLKFINKNTREISYNDITLYSVENYYISIQTKKDKSGLVMYTSDSYQQGVWCALNNFLGFMTKRNYIPCNYMEEIKKPKNKDLERINRDRILLNQDDFSKIMKCVDKGIGNHSRLRTRDKLVLLLFMSTGMRKTALSEINIEDIDLINRTFSIIDKGRIIHSFDLNDKTYHALVDWLSDREDLLGDKESSALFITEKRERLCGDGIDGIVEKYGEAALGYHISPHKLRSGFISVLYDITKNVEFVRRAVGHSNIATTQRYIVTENKERKLATKYINDIIG